MKNISKGLGVANAKRDIPSPYISANPFSRLTLWWLNSHVWHGFQKPLSPTDIYTVIPEEMSDKMGLKLQESWEKISVDKQCEPNRLLRTVLLNDWKLFSVALFLIIVGEISKFVQPFLISQLVSYFKGKKYVNETEAWGYGAGMVLLTLTYAVFSTYGQFLGQIVAMRWRTSCTAMMYRKAARLSSKSLSELSSGTVINLLATDVEKFYNAALEFRGLFVGPLVMLALLSIVSITMKLAIVPALVFVIVLTMLRLMMGNISGKIRLILAALSDRRIMMVTEVISAIRMVKVYCWEKIVIKAAHKIRAKEVQSVGWVVFMNGLNLNLGYICDKVITFLLVLTFIKTGNSIDYKTAIQILTWMKMGQLGFLNFPIGYSMWKQMEASLSRIQKFLNAEEFVIQKPVHKTGTYNTTAGVTILLKNCSASWAVSEKKQTKAQKLMKNSLLTSISSMTSQATGDNFVASGTFSLRNIDLEVKQGMLVGLIGPVGSGKTSLLLAMLGTLKLGNGERTMVGKFAYVPQQHWMMTDTVRNNILMGEKMNRDKYSKVIQACALQKDMAALSDGDSTMLADKGSSLSGGQSARISLARAAYREADIYILDDPFSSLDSKVSAYIFQECIQGLLKDKIVIMATHDIELLQNTDKVVVLKEGKILASGPFNEIKASMNLSEMVRESEMHMEEDDEDGDVFAVEDKKNLLMPLFSTSHVKQEHAHIPKKRATPFNVYLTYWKAGYGYVLMTLFCLLLVAQQGLAILAEYWLVYKIAGKSKTGDDGYGGNSSSSSQSHGASSYTVHDAHTQVEASYAAKSSPPISAADQELLLGSYTLYILLSVALGILSVIVGTGFIVSAAKNLYNAMFMKVVWAPMKIFTSDRAGEMVNRFARDTGRMDDIIPITINAAFMTGAIIISQMTYICIINKYVVIATLPFLLVLVFFVLYTIRAMRDTKRLESEFRTPTFSHLQCLLSGLEVIRAFEMETRLIKESDSLLDRHTAAWHMYIGTVYWMKMRVNCLVTLYLAIVLITALASPNSEAAASALGLSLAYIIVFMQRIQYFATYVTMLETNMTSVEHVADYSNLEQEPANHKGDKVPDNWPVVPSISFSKVNLTHQGEDKPALKNITFNVEAKEKVGIVGRTGAGKSTLLSVMVRLNDNFGHVKVDGIDIQSIGLTDLRSKITFLLQEPQIQTGTIRYNLDPSNKFTDDEIWEALAKVKIKAKVKKMPGCLQMEMEANGSNFSRGQIQMVCMARALLKKNKIVLLDEITANIDKEMCGHLTEMIDAEFKDCTVMHVAHRIETLILYDKILVLDAGRLQEFDHPHILLQNAKGGFYSMVQQLGPHQANHLENRAKQSFENRHNLTESALTQHTNDHVINKDNAAADDNVINKDSAAADDNVINKDSAAADDNSNDISDTTQSNIIDVRFSR